MAKHETATPALITLLRQEVDQQGRYKRWIAKQAGLTPDALSHAFALRRTMRMDRALRLVEVLGIPQEKVEEAQHVRNVAS